MTCPDCGQPRNFCGCEWSNQRFSVTPLIRKKKMKDTDICNNCGCEFAEHNYVADSINKYKCPHPHIEGGYGFFCGGDPRMFSPDPECCSKTEIENHRKACDFWDEQCSQGEIPEPEECPSGWEVDENGKRYHVTRAPYGIGTFTMEFEQFFEPREFDYEEEE